MLLDAEQLVEQLTERLRTEVASRALSAPLIVGIRTGGVWVAERLHAGLKLQEPLSTLDISFYRDDFSRIGMHPQVQPSSLPVSIDERHVILVDDVLYSGRTVRAALNELFDYGRPASVMLAVLIDRGERELPIEARVVGQTIQLKRDEQVRLQGPSPLSLRIVQTTRPHGG